MSADSEDIVVETAGPIAVVRLNRPDRGNSVTPDVVSRLGDAVTGACALDSVRAVVLTGTGSVFCAGADVQEMYAVFNADGPDGLMNYLGEVWMPAVQRTVRAIWSAPKPIVAAYNGAATAGGLDFGLACDVRIAAEGARFAESYVNLGMVPVAGGAFLLPHLVGASVAIEMLASGKFIDAARAREVGMVSQVCSADELIERATELAAGLAQSSAATFAALKAVVRSAASLDLESILKASYDANVELLQRPEVRERVIAVMERYSRSTH